MSIQINPGPSSRGRGEMKMALAALNFTKRLVSGYGYVTEGELWQMSEAGYSNDEIIQMVSALGLSLLVAHERKTA